MLYMFSLYLNVGESVHQFHSTNLRKHGLGQGKIFSIHSRADVKMNSQGLDHMWKTYARPCQARENPGMSK